MSILEHVLDFLTEKFVVIFAGIITGALIVITYVGWYSPQALYWLGVFWFVFFLKKCIRSELAIDLVRSLSYLLTGVVLFVAGYVLQT